MITAQRLRELFDYEPETGLFSHKAGKCMRGCKAGSVGVVTDRGYLSITIDHKHYRAHRLAWLYVYGVMPRQIDHIDRNRLNNAIANLRECSRNENQWNSGSRREDMPKGVSYYKNGYTAQITVRSKQIYLGRFKTIAAAQAAYARAAAEFHGEFACAA